MGPKKRPKCTVTDHSEQCGAWNQEVNFYSVSVRHRHKQILEEM